MNSSPSNQYSFALPAQRLGRPSAAIVSVSFPVHFLNGLNETKEGWRVHALVKRISREGKGKK